jgi:hypothetical protein
MPLAERRTNINLECQRECDTGNPKPVHLEQSLHAEMIQSTLLGLNFADKTPLSR